MVLRRLRDDTRWAALASALHQHTGRVDALQPGGCLGRAPAPVLLPLDELLGRIPERDDDELPVVPLGPEPEEEVDAEDDGDRPEAELVRVPAGPLEQRVEPVGEKELTEEERQIGEDGWYVPSPL